MSPESGDRFSRIQVSSAVLSGPATNVNKLAKKESSSKIKLIKKLHSLIGATNKTKFSVTGQWDTNFCSLNLQGIE